MHGESLKVGGAFQTMSEVVHSVRQGHLQHRELDTNYAASICDWLYTCSYSFSFFLCSACQYVWISLCSAFVVVCSIITSK